MTFNDTTNKNGMIQSCETWLFGNDYGAITGNTNLLATFTRLINNGLDEVISKILSCDNKWQFDDSNYTDYPIGVTNLVNLQQDYPMSVSQIKIIAVEVKDNEGNWRQVQQLDIKDIQAYNTTITDFMETAGFPLYYDVKADSLFLYPKPATANVTLTNGLKVYYQREPSYFVSTDTTKKPGFASVFHDIPVLYACTQYAKANSMTSKARELDAEIQKRVKDMVDFFSQRDADYKPRMLPRYRWPE